MSRTASHSDRYLLLAVLFLVMLGVLMVYSASSFRGAEKYGDSTLFLKSHLQRVFLGLLFLFLFSRMDYRKLRTITPLFFLFVGLLLFFVLTQPEFHGCRRWFFLANRRFQPSEMMKLGMILYLAAVFAENRSGKASQKGKEEMIVVAVHYGILLATVGLIFIEPDLGSSIVLFCVGFIMFFLGGVSMRNLGKMALALIPLVGLGILAFPYQRVRLQDYLASAFGSGSMSYQIKQSIIGLAHGGFTGVGYGGGKQKLLFLPEPFSDFILTSLGEEFGFIGVMLVFALLVFLLWRGVRIAMHAPDRYGFLLAGGITTMILVNALINAGVVLNLLPTTGLPFPFLSYGGTSLFIQLIGVGILLSISRQAEPTYRDFTRYRGQMNRYGDR